MVVSDLGKWFSSRFVLPLIVLAFSTSVVKADVIFDNFGPGDTHSNLAWALGTSPGITSQEFAMPFAVPTGQDFFLDSIELAVFGQGGANELTIDVYSSLEGVGVSLGSVTLFDELPPGPGSLVEVDGFDVLLESGQTYWVGASLPNGNGGWFFNSFDEVGLIGDRREELPDYPAWRLTENELGAFRVNATAAIPEPGAASLLGLIGLLVARRRRRSS